jgi:AAA15 family ATPase/GTPase
MLEGASRTRDIHLMGEGMEKLLNLILAIAICKGGCVFLDEFENGLHYSGVAKIWEAVAKALRKYDCQLITSTHSYECLRAAFEGLAGHQEDFRYIRLDRKADEITAKLFNYAMISEAIKTSLEIR